MFNFNRNQRLEARAFTPVPEFFVTDKLALMACGGCRGYFVPLSFKDNGTSRIVGLACLTCEFSSPVDEAGFLPSGGAA